MLWKAHTRAARGAGAMVDDAQAARLCRTDTPVCISVRGAAIAGKPFSARRTTTSLQTEDLVSGGHSGGLTQAGGRTAMPSQRQSLLATSLYTSTLFLPLGKKKSALDALTAFSHSIHALASATFFRAIPTHRCCLTRVNRLF